MITYAFLCHSSIDTIYLHNLKIIPKNMKVKAFFESNFFKKGLPFIIVCVGGSFGLKGFTSLRYEYSKKSSITREDFEREGIKMKPPSELTLEAQYEKMQKMDIDNWENVRGPRPWEEGSIEENKNRSKNT